MYILHPASIHVTVTTHRVTCTYYNLRESMYILQAAGVTCTYYKLQGYMYLLQPAGLHVNITTNSERSSDLSGNVYFVYGHPMSQVMVKK